MGILRAAASSIDGMYADVWREYFICDSLPADLLMLQVQKRVSEKSGNNGSDDLISNKSLIVVNEGQCALITNMGKIIAVYEEPGEHEFIDPEFSNGVKGVMKNFWKRFSFGGDVPPAIHRVYYINTKECMGVPLNDMAPIPLRMADRRFINSVENSVKISGVYSFRITDPVKFYKFAQMTGKRGYVRSSLISQINSEIYTHLRSSASSIIKNITLPHEVLEHIPELQAVVEKKYSEILEEKRGISIVSAAINVS